MQTAAGYWVIAADVWGLHAVVLAVLAAWATRQVVRRRVLRSIRDICEALERINLAGEGRVDVPRGQAEIARLARGINGILDQARQMRNFASDVSHELRTPLTALRLQIEELQLSKQRADLDELLCRELRNVERLEEIVSDLLFLSRLKEGTGFPRSGPVDLGELAREEVALHEGRIPVKLDVADGVWVNGVASQLRRVLRNLLDNAQRHAHSSVTVTVGRNAELVELAVADDGNGVPPAERERIFERFVRLEESRRLDPYGTGLGLPICREIATAHGGSLHVEESVTGGACFVVRLPLLAPRDREAAPVTSSARPLPGQKPRLPVSIKWIHLVTAEGW